MLLVGAIRVGPDEHLNLVELMNSKYAAGVLAVGTGLAPEAC
ncbi:unannotated protein [freshwater metagenome]|uniref:Unannotated protein n=1 Tax=freshwater metagenome TaxID=449393 RepID=A0A6J6MRY9_9ZZZZ